MSDDTEQSKMLTGRTSKGQALSVVDSRAMKSVTLADVPALKGSIQDFGRSSTDRFSHFDQPTFSWRTSQLSLSGEWAEFLETWPPSGMTRSGIAYRLPPSAPLTYELGSGYWPTPVGDDTGHRRKAYSQGGRSLSMTLGGHPNPEYVEWLMGFPLGWTDLEPSATP
jgi:hypothetical protein